MAVREEDFDVGRGKYSVSLGRGLKEASDEGKVDKK
jgi:hypothetical protein